MFYWLKNLRSKLLFAFLLVLLIPLTATALYGQVFARGALTGQAVERSVHQAHLQAESIVSSLRHAQGDALYLAALRSLRVMRQQTQPEDVSSWRAEVAQDFMVLLSVRPMYRAIRYLDTEGMEQINVVSDGRTVNIVTERQDRSRKTYFRYTIMQPPGSTYVSAFARSQEVNEQGVPFIHYALHMPDGGGVILIDLHAGWLLRNLPDAESSDIWALVDQDGEYLVYPDHFDPAIHRDDLSPMLAGGQGTFETDHSVYTYDTVYPSGSTPWQFWVIYRETSKSMLYANLSDFYWAAGGFTLSGIVLAGLLAFALSRALAKPIIQLEQMAVAFGRDGVPPALPARLSNDEIGSLARTFHQMAHELERKRKQEHRLIEQLIRAQEEERKLVAYDLHDGLIQQLVGARFYLTNCREHCGIHAEAARQGIKRGCEALSEAIAEGRRIIEGLRPAVLDDLGLTEAIEETARATAQAAGWTLRLDLQRIPAEPDKSVAVTLFRIMQEALNNARKHAQAKHVSISLYNGHGIGMRIKDDGIGFDASRLTEDGHGLGVTAMHERAALLGGTCVITSAPGAGTQIEVWVPSEPVAQPIPLTVNAQHAERVMS